MRWWRIVLYVLPVLVAGSYVLAYGVLSARGAQCQGDLLDGSGLSCNDLGEIRFDAFFVGIWVEIIAIPIWAAWILMNAVNAIRSRRPPGFVRK